MKPPAAKKPATQLLPADSSASAAPSLSPDQQEIFLQLMARGASPAGICQQLGLSVFSYLNTLSGNPLFRQQEAQILLLLSQNIAAALYKAAMEGSVTAQTFWLKCQPPPGWQQPVPSSVPSDSSFNEYNDHELLTLARAMGIDVPHGLETEAD